LFKAGIEFPFLKFIPATQTYETCKKKSNIQDGRNARNAHVQAGVGW